MKHYFCAELQQIEDLPQSQPLIVAMNHAGMCFPWDFMGLAYLLGQTRGWLVQPLADVSLFEHPWVIWWLPPGWSHFLGGVRAQFDDFEAAVSHKIVLLYAPEGVRGPGKGSSRCYQLETFDPSLIRLSDRYRIPILPVVCLGNESLHPGAGNLKKLAKRFSLPFFPLSVLMFAFALFPSMGIWAMRTTLHYHIQPLYQPWTEAPLGLSVRQSRSHSYQQAQRFREKLQTQINRLLGEPL
jgi:1-acyl-sn-glycerol-3-phosphate acyltransferase